MISSTLRLVQLEGGGWSFDALATLQAMLYVANNHDFVELTCRDGQVVISNGSSYVICKHIDASTCLRLLAARIYGDVGTRETIDPYQFTGKCSLLGTWHATVSNRSGNVSVRMADCN
jgi:hypothetical protein